MLQLAELKLHEAGYVLLLSCCAAMFTSFVGQVFLLARHDWQQCIEEAARRSAECADRVGFGADGAMGLGGGVTLLDGLPGMRTGNRSEGTSVCSGHAAGFAVSPAAAGSRRYGCFTAVLPLLLLYCFTTAVLVFCGAVGVMRCAAAPTAAHRIMCVLRFQLPIGWVVVPTAALRWL
jgi:hypothetical protein